MIAINEPIGGFVALVNLEKDILSQQSIESSVANLVDLIKIRIQEKSIEEVANSLLENIFDLRIDLIEWLAGNDKNLKNYFESLEKHISVNLQLSPFSNLAETISTVLLAYDKIVSPLFKPLSSSFNNLLEELNKNKPEYHTFKLFALHPSPQIKFLKDWIDASLQLDVGLILSHLILTDQINFSKKRIKPELIEFLCSKIIRFGAFSIFTGFWSPASDDLSKLTNSMKILVATMELDNKSFYRISKEDFFKLIHN